MVLLHRQVWLGTLGCIVAGIGIALLASSRHRDELLQVAHVTNGPTESAERSKDLGQEIDRLALACSERGERIATVYGSWHGMANCRIKLFRDTEGIRITFIHYSTNGRPNALMGATANPKAQELLLDGLRSNRVMRGRDACAKLDRAGIPVLIITKPGLCTALERDLI